MSPPRGLGQTDGVTGLAQRIPRRRPSTIAIVSVPGAGTVVAAEPPAAPTPARPPGPSAPELRRRGRDERVLVGEDREIVRELTCSILEEAGYTVVAAAGGAEALLLTDVVMPDMSGVDLAARLREAQPDLRVL
jgi:hypothetical protein